MKTSESIKEISVAMNKVQSSIGIVGKNVVNPFFNSKYADLSNILNVLNPQLYNNGLSIIQSSTIADDNVIVCTRVLHISGEWIETYTSVPAKQGNKYDPHTVGSAITYGRRYGICSTFNISADEDDDGNNATGKKQTDEKQKSIDILPDDIKDLFRQLQYKREAVYGLCEKFKWDEKEIKSQLENKLTKQG